MTISSAETRHGHIVVATLAAWGEFSSTLARRTRFLISLSSNDTGHTKSAVTFLCKLVRMKRIYASILVSKTYYEKIVKEVDLRFLPGEEDSLKAMIRLVVAIIPSYNPDTHDCVRVIAVVG